MTSTDLNSPETRQELVATAANVMKCLAFASAKVNQNRRLALKPQLAKRYRNLCDYKQASHMYLLGADLTKSVKDMSEASKLGSHIAVQRRRQNRSQGRRQGGRRFRQQFRGKSHNLGHQTHSHDQQYLHRVARSSVNSVVKRLHSGLGSTSSGSPGLDRQAFSSIQPSRSFSNATPLCNRNTLKLLPSVVLSRSPERTSTVSAGSSGPQSAATPAAAAQESQARRGQLELVQPWSQVSLSDINLLQTPFVCGGVSLCLDKWRSLTHNPEILQAVQGGGS